MAFCGYLKQSTAVTIQLGPFVDEDDGKTAEDGLTIEDTDVYLSKNGAAQANPNDTDNAANDDNGYYTKALDATDTGTLGLLTVVVHESGALPVRQDYQVVTAHWWDTMCGSDYLNVDVIQVEGSDATDQIRDSVVDDATRIDASSINAIEAKVDTVDGIVDDILVDTAEIGAAGAGLTAVPWNAAWDAEVESEVDDALGAGGADLTAIPWNAAWDAEVESEVEDALGAGGADLTAIPWNAAWDAEVESEVEDAVGADVTAILADTNELQTDDVPGLIAALNDLSAAEVNAEVDTALGDYDPPTKAELDAGLAGLNDPTAAAIADAVWDEALADHTGSGSAGEKLGDVDTLGSGAITFTYTLTSTVDSSAIEDADVWVTSDEAGNTVVASGQTNGNGEVTFYLNAGTYYVWRQKAGWNFTNPDTETVS